MCEPAFNAPSAEPVRKVLAYITRSRGGQTELLVFRQQHLVDPPLEVPGGTVDPGETLEAAVLREVAEESGLVALTPRGPVGTAHFPWEGVLHHRSFYHFTAEEQLPDAWSHTVTAGEEDLGLVFLYHWLPVDEAAATLGYEMGLFLPSLLPMK